MQLTFADVSEAVGAHPDRPVDSALALAGVSTDTRSLKAGEIFVALKNERMDGHDFLAQALAQGAAGAVVARAVPGAALPQIVVADTEIAYGQIARSWRRQFAGPVIGITGSVGKTTTKEMTAAALSPLGPIVRTEKSGRGQIASLCEIALPVLGAITAIAENHIELLGSVEAIADAKGELFESLPAGGAAVLNVAEPYFLRLRNRTQARLVTVGVERDADFVAAGILSTPDGWRLEVNGAPVLVRSASRHDIANALLAIALAVEAGVSLADATTALSDTYQPPAMRMQVERASGWSGVVLNDAYNAAPASVRSALETLRGFPGRRKVAFLGDMKELGDLAIDAHRALGDTLAIGGIDAVYTVGSLAAEIPGAKGRFASSEEAARFVAATYRPMPDDVVLVKGSRAMAMERVVEALLAKDGGAPAHG
jgi:UDP-N-acetylmuramyl pentapeptide synthase